MDSHYYLLAQLPTLRFDAAPPLTAQALLEEADKWLAPQDLQWVARALDPVSATAATEGDAPVALLTWEDFEARLCTDVAAWRCARREGQTAPLFLLTPEQLTEGTPLDTELELLRTRWAVTEDLATEHHFDVEAVILYAARLRLLLQRAVFDPEAGLHRYRQLSEITT
mgnify:CR=1 FL=1